MPSFAGATEWLNSEPLGPAEFLKCRVVLAFSAPGRNDVVRNCRLSPARARGSRDDV
jgi:hypothetical protein